MSAIIAHRGNAAEAPENTLAAFRAALACGADGVELDVQASRDGVPVVIHDECLARTTSGHGRVGEHTAAALGALDAGGWFAPAFAGEGVPTLAAVLALLAGSALQVHIELKTTRCEYPGLVPAVLEAVADAGLEARVVLSSFNHETLLQALGLAPHLPCAALLGQRLLAPWDYARRHGFGALHLHRHAADAEVIGACHAHGLAVRVWTVDAADEAARFRDAGADAIITNRPRDLLAPPGGRGAGGP